MRKKALLLLLIALVAFGTVAASTSFVGACGKNAGGEPDPC